LHGANNAEAPHLYKVRGTYYLLIAEGGTGENHAVTVFRSKNLRGPYEGNRKNPILTHRHLGREYPFACMGHADLVETQKGEWWMVMLGVRPYGGFHYNLGRETFLARVVWEDGWPVVNPGHGRVLESFTPPDLPAHPFPPPPARDDFNDTTLDLSWNFLRTPRETICSLKERPGYLRLRLRPAILSKWENPSFIGRRQRHIDFSASTAMEFVPQTESESAGIVLIQNSDFQFRMESLLSGGRQVLRLTRRHAAKEESLAEQPLESGHVYLKVAAIGQAYSFLYGTAPGSWKVLKENVDGRTLSRTNAGGFVGTYIALYASGNGQPSRNTADFDWFEYLGGPGR
jgi:alpha-N-arabinofuranosidase